MMETIALIAAMESEFASLSSLYAFNGTKNRKEASAYGKNILLLKSGIGKVNAALAAAKACDNGANLVITAGLAGGIDAALSQGDVVLADKACYHDVWCGEPNQKGQVQDFPLYYDAPQNVLTKVLSAAPNGYFKTGLIVTGDKFLTDAAALLAIKQDFPKALAVDMESAAVAQVCYIKKVPFLSLRIISDVVGKQGQEEQYNNFWQNVPEKSAQMVDTLLKLL